MFKLQGPQEDLDYHCDYSPELADSGSPQDTIVTSTWTISGPDVGASPGPEVHTDTSTIDTASAFVRQLTRGGLYVLKNEAETEGGRTLRRAITIRCEHTE